MSDSSEGLGLVGGGAGVLVGFALGGPLGALAGGALGALAGNMIENSSSEDPVMGAAYDRWVASRNAAIAAQIEYHSYIDTKPPKGRVQRADFDARKQRAEQVYRAAWERFDIETAQNRELLNTLDAKTRQRWLDAGLVRHDVERETPHPQSGRITIGQIDPEVAQQMAEDFSARVDAGMDKVMDRAAKQVAHKYGAEYVKIDPETDEQDGVRVSRHGYAFRLPEGKASEQVPVGFIDASGNLWTY